MKQQTFSDFEYSCRKRKTRRDKFLESADEIVPWDEWVRMIAPHYPSGRRGRPPIGIEKMLRMYLLRIWFDLSDSSTEDAIYDSYAMRKFTGIDFMKESVPDKTTLRRFRRLLEENGLDELFASEFNRIAAAAGRALKGGRIIDAAIMRAPSLAKKKNPGTHRSKNGSE